MRRLIVILLLAASSAFAQQPAAPSPAQQPAPLPQARQLAALFGTAFHPASGFAVLLADFDRDGAEDAMVVATADDPLVDQLQFKYKVIDPFHAYFGMDDPKVTATLIPREHPHVLLVVHNWRAPRLKFAVINLPFDRLQLSRVVVKKKAVAAILLEESSGTKSYLFWDGKKWRWRDSSID